MNNPNRAPKVEDEEGVSLESGSAGGDATRRVAGLPSKNRVPSDTIVSTSHGSMSLKEAQGWDHK